MAILQHAQTLEVDRVIATDFGVKYIVEGALNAPNGRTPLLRAVWQIDHEQTVPHLVTAYPVNEEKS